MMIAVPMELIGVEYYNMICMQFKWADSDTLLDSMSDLYIDGDMAPLGRLNYVYQNYIPGVSTDVEAAAVITMEQKASGKEPTVETETETESTPDAETVTDPEIETESESVPVEEVGCKAIAGGAALMAIICLCGVMLGKKKD